jgi:hypothetical protein
MRLDNIIAYFFRLSVPPSVSILNQLTRVLTKSDENFVTEDNTKASPTVSNHNMADNVNMGW